MEGLRGAAVSLVFLQHYSMQFLVHGDVSGVTGGFAKTFRTFGNYGVELFFVLSGYLIYGILLRRRPAFFAFMARRAQRLYPVFLVVLTLAAAVDFLRPEPKIAAGYQGLLYLAENIAFLPGLLPIEPLFAVNWSLSYEWWFYASATLMFSVLGLSALPKAGRIGLILGLAGALITLSALDLPNVPIRGLPLFAGMLLVEYRGKSPGAVSVPLAFGCFVGAMFAPTAWATSLLLAIGFGALCASAIENDSLVAKPLSWRYLRWFGNMSYSYYLVHGLIVVFCLRALFLVSSGNDLSFWLCLVPVFAFSALGGALLFLFVEKPYSLQQQTEATRLAAIAEHGPQPAAASDRSRDF
jgi:exopolysaccharide production protein ExoZ